MHLTNRNLKSAMHARLLRAPNSTPHAPRPTPHAPRSGFTLIEVILAVGLMVVLFGVLYQTLAAHLRAQEISEAEVRRYLRARTLLHHLADEIRATVLVGS